MNEQWIREGFEHYYVVPKTEGEDYEDQVLLSHMVTGILPCEVRRTEDEESYYFHLVSSDLYIDQIGKLDAAEFFAKLVRTIEEAEDYLLNPDRFLLTPRHVYVCSGKPALCYVPGYEADITEQLKEFVQFCVEQLDYGNRSQVTFFYGLHNRLSKGTVSLRELKEFVEPEPVWKEEKEVLPEAEESRDFEAPGKDKAKIGKENLCSVLMYVPLLFGAAYFTARAWNEGMTYSNLRGIVIGGSLLIFNTGCLWVRLKNRETASGRAATAEQQPPDETMLMCDETVLLTQNKLPVLKLLGRNKEEIEVSSREFTVGRQEENVDLYLPQQGVSRRHFQILKEGECYLIRDMGSKNGTFVNDERVWRETELKNGDVIKAGTEQIEFMV